VLVHYNQHIITISKILNIAELDYNVIRGTEYFVLLQTSVVLTEEHNVMVNNEELTGTTEHLTIKRRGVTQANVVISGFHCTMCPQNVPIF
jgi:hypothetical protein